MNQFLNWLINVVGAVSRAVVGRRPQAGEANPHGCGGGVDHAERVAVPVATVVVPVGESVFHLAQMADERVGERAVALGTHVHEPALVGRAGSVVPPLDPHTSGRPLGGVGYGNYPELYQDYSPWIGLDPRREPREAHSLYLEVASETGVLGLGVLTIGLALARALIVRGRRQLGAVGATSGLLMLDALGLALIAFLITSVFLHGAYPRVFWLLFGASVG